MSTFKRKGYNGFGYVAEVGGRIICFANEGEAEEYAETLASVGSQTHEESENQSELSTL